MNPISALVLYGPLLLGSLVVHLFRTPRGARIFALLASATSFVLALVLLGFNTIGVPFGLGHSWRLAEYLGTDGLTAALLPIATGIPLAIVAAAPRADLDRRGSASVLAVSGATLGALLAHDLLLTGAFFCLSAAPLVVKASRSNDAALKRAARFLFVSSIVPFAIACAAAVSFALLAGARHPTEIATFHRASLLGRHQAWVGALFVIAIAARMGVFPLHLWVPVITERARPTVAVTTIVSPIGAVTLVRVVAEVCPDALTRGAALILPVAALSAAYGAILAIGQNQGQRQLGYIWTSLMGTVLAGLVAGPDEGVTGALLHQLAVALSATGLALHLRAVAARTGTMDLRRLGGLVENAPGLATGYLLLSLSTVAFPSTATFMSEDLLVKGLLKDHPAIAAVLLMATALNGLTLVRTWKRIFLGPPSVHAPDLARVADVQPRERWTAVALMFALLAGGLGPTPLLLLRAGLRAQASKVAPP